MEDDSSDRRSFWTQDLSFSPVFPIAKQHGVTSQQWIFSGSKEANPQSEASLEESIDKDPQPSVNEFQDCGSLKERNMELIFCYPWPGRLLSMGCRSNGIQHLEPSKNIPEWFYGNLCTPQITTTICRPFFGDDKELHVFNSKFLVVRCVLECQGVAPPMFGMPGVALEVQGEASQNGKRHEVCISLHVCL